MQEKQAYCVPLLSREHHALQNSRQTSSRVGAQAHGVSLYQDKRRKGALPHRTTQDQDHAHDGAHQGEQADRLHSRIRRPRQHGRLQQRNARVAHRHHRYTRVQRRPAASAD